MLVNWKSNVPKTYKRNAINGDLNRSYQISMNFDNEKKNNKTKNNTIAEPVSLQDLLTKSFINLIKC